MKTRNKFKNKDKARNKDKSKETVHQSLKRKTHKIVLKNLNFPQKSNKNNKTHCQVHWKILT